MSDLVQKMNLVLNKETHVKLQLIRIDADLIIEFFHTVGQPKRSQ